MILDDFKQRDRSRIRRPARRAGNAAVASRLPYRPARARCGSAKRGVAHVVRPAPFGRHVPHLLQQPGVVRGVGGLRPGEPGGEDARAATQRIDGQTRCLRPGPRPASAPPAGTPSSRALSANVWPSSTTFKRSGEIGQRLDVEAQRREQSGQFEALLAVVRAQYDQSLFGHHRISAVGRRGSGATTTTVTPRGTRTSDLRVLPFADGSQLPRIAQLDAVLVVFDHQPGFDQAAQRAGQASRSSDSDGWRRAA